MEPPRFLTRDWQVQFLPSSCRGQLFAVGTSGRKNWPIPIFKDRPGHRQWPKEVVSAKEDTFFAFLTTGSGPECWIWPGQDRAHQSTLLLSVSINEVVCV